MKLKVLCTLCFITFFIVSHCNSARILYVSNSFSKSHVLVASELLRQLARRGHEITQVSSFPEETPLENFRNIFIPVDDKFMDIVKDVLQNPSVLNALVHIPEIIRTVNRASLKTLDNPDVMAIKNEHFDLMIFGYMGTDFPFLIADHFQCPVIISYPRGAWSIVEDLVGNESPISSVPFDGIDRKMSFTKRVKNMFKSVMLNMFVAYINYEQRNVYREAFPEGQYPPLDELKRNVSLVLLNEHFTQSVPRPYVQNMIEVGGLQIKDKPSPLPQDIQKWLDEATNGTIFISMGTNFKFSYMPKEGIDVFKKTLGKLKQRILWTFDGDDMEEKPENVMLKKWFPQDDILAHPNLQIFISHGGLGSVVESKYHGVPIIGIPQFGDQEQNINGIVAEGWAIRIDKNNVTEDSLGGAIQEMLNNPAYSAKVKELSFLYRDRPQTALETAIFWVEYVIRHKGAPHMRFQGVDLNFFQRNSIDVLAFLALFIYIFYLLIKLIFVILCKVICSRRKKEKIN